MSSFEDRDLLVHPCRNVKIGIVGMPNAGKTAFFNVLSHSDAPADDFLFCTVDPNFATFPIFDERLDKIAHTYDRNNPARAYVSMADVCGLVRDSYQGDGLGNDGLAYLQSADILLHVIRAFNDDNITHAEESVDPVRDARIIHRELIARDIETISRALSSKDYIVNKGKCGREDMYEHQTLRKVYKVLTGSEYVPVQRGTVSYMSAEMSMSRQPSAVDGGSVPSSPTKQRRNLTLFPEEPQQAGQNVREVTWEAAEKAIIMKYQLMTAKEVIYILNLSTRDYLRFSGVYQAEVQAVVDEELGGGRVLSTSVSFERLYRHYQATAEIEEYLAANPTHISTIDSILSAVYRVLKLIVFYTVSTNEIKSWVVRQGISAPEAGGIIHTDIERGFICVDVMTYDDLIELGSEAHVRRVGKLRQQGKKYVVNDGDICFYQYNKGQ